MFRRIVSFVVAAWRAGREPEPRDGTLLHIAAMVATRPCECLGNRDTCAPCLARPVLGIEEPPDLPGELRADLHEAIVRARVTAHRAGERELAAALQAVLLLHLTGGSPAPVAALAMPEPTEEAVN